MLTYNSEIDDRADRDAQRRVLVALNGTKNKLRKDEGGSWRITGKKGHVYTWGDHQAVG